MPPPVHVRSHLHLRAGSLGGARRQLLLWLLRLLQLLLSGIATSRLLHGRRRALEERLLAAARVLLRRRWRRHGQCRLQPTDEAAHCHDEPQVVEFDDVDASVAPADADADDAPTATTPGFTAPVVAWTAAPAALAGAAATVTTASEGS
jgi:hypothetical protein